MRKCLFAAFAALLFAATPVASAAGFELGVGANYWYSIDEAKDHSFDRDGLGWMISGRLPLAQALALGLEIEQTPDNFVFLKEKLYLPAAYLILGDAVYMGFGVGTYYYDDEFYGDVWYALRAGFKIPIIPNGLVLDINANYRVENWDGIKSARDDVDTDTLMIGAALRLVF